MEVSKYGDGPSRLSARAWRPAVAFLVVFPLTVRAQSERVASLTPDEYADEAKLVELLWNQSPDVLEARTAAGIAASEVTRAGRFPNPALDFTWGTIPVGRTNPPHVSDPLDRVPNYTAGLSELIELAKRGPRQAASIAEYERSHAQALAALATRFFDLLGAVGHIAKSQLRAAVTGQLVEASSALLDLDRARASKGDIAVVDLDRAEVEHDRLLATRDAALTELETARAECVAIVGVPCEAFESGKSARAFLERAATAALPAQWSDELEHRRPDIAALDAALRAARQRATLAQHKVIPDVTVRLGYTYDQFVLSGNQRNSVSLGMQLPLPVADQGQADVQAATATLVRAAQTRQVLADTGRITLQAATRRRELIATRARQLDSALAKARDVRDTLTAAQRRGGTSLTDVLLARRGYQELLLDRSDLDAEAFEAVLKVRAAAALFPRPSDQPEVYAK